MCAEFSGQETNFDERRLSYWNKQQSTAFQQRLAGEKEHGTCLSTLSPMNLITECQASLIIFWYVWPKRVFKARPLTEQWKKDWRVSQSAVAMPLQRKIFYHTTDSQGVEYEIQLWRDLRNPNTIHNEVRCTDTKPRSPVYINVWESASLLGIQFQAGLPHSRVCLHSLLRNVVLAVTVGLPYATKTQESIVGAITGYTFRSCIMPEEVIARLWMFWLSFPNHPAFVAYL